MIDFDTSDFDKKFKELNENTIPGLMEKGMGRAMFNLLNDCVLQRPTVPLKEGWLRGSGSIFVQNKLVAVSSHGKQGKANTELIEPIESGKFIGVIGFNTPYAAKMHEGIDLKFSKLSIESGAGPKYLESKLQRNRDSYMQEIADTIREGGGA
jgi:hypothetical protein